MNEPKDNEPKSPPADWHLHIERDLSWMLNENVTLDERRRFADRIRDMVVRVRAQECDLRTRLRAYEPFWVCSIQCGWAATRDDVECEVGQRCPWCARCLEQGLDARQGRIETIGDFDEDGP
jgi:hypothetical protein